MTSPDLAPPASGFKLDHIVIRTPARDALVAEVAADTGLPDLDGFKEAGRLHSRGIRFAGGPFLDVFSAEVPQCALILRGAVADAERRAAAQGWSARLLPRDAQGEPAYPWSMLLFRRGQGLLTQISIIDYEPDPRAWASDSFDRPLYPIRPPPQSGAALTRVWMGAEDAQRAERDLQALGYAPDGPVESRFWPYAGARFRSQGTDLVLFAGPDGVARFDVASGLGPARELALPGGPAMVLDEAAA